MENKKNSRRKLFATLGLLFGVAAIGSVAFAGYVLSDPKINQPGTNTPGDIVIDNQSYTLTGTIDPSDKLYFYPEAAVDSGRVKYTPESGITANLDLELKVTIDRAGSSAFLQNKNITVHVDSSATDGESGQDAVAKGYITLPGDATKAITDEVDDYTIDLTFGWGATFGGTDPCEYFNSGDGADKELGTQDDGADDDTVNGILNDFKASLANTTITITIDLEDAAA